MKKINLLIFLMLISAVFSNVFGQMETPAGAGDKNLQDNDIKMRSVEIERVKRDAEKANAASFAPINKEIKAKFPEIKADFENIQISQTAIIKTYTTGEKINYNLIQTSAESINKSAKRLNSNLFATKAEKKDDKSKEKEEKAKSIKTLIIELDNAIGSFVSSKIFGNISVIDTAVAVKTRTDLFDILELSHLLLIESGKLK